MKRKFFVYKWRLLLWLNRLCTRLFGRYMTAQEIREQKRIIKQAIHYNKHIIKPGEKYRSVVLSGRRY